MFSTERQNKLNPILEALRQIPGVESVQQDDFDSVGINVFLWLVRGQSYGNVPYTFQSPLRSVKAAIKRVCLKHNVGFNFLHWPTMRYETSFGEKRKSGYDCEHIKIEVMV